MINHFKVAAELMNGKKHIGMKYDDFVKHAISIGGSAEDADKIISAIKSRQDYGLDPTGTNWNLTGGPK